VRAARNVILLSILPFLADGEMSDIYTNICQNVNHGNALLSPLRGQILPNVPPPLVKAVLGEVSTFFLDYFGNNRSEKFPDREALLDPLHGDLDDITMPTWQELATYMRILAM
jgi:hypothetical protein